MCNVKDDWYPATGYSTESQQKTKPQTASLIRSLTGRMTSSQISILGRKLEGGKGEKEGQGNRKEMRGDGEGRQREGRESEVWNEERKEMWVKGKSKRGREVKKVRKGDGGSVGSEEKDINDINVPSLQQILSSTVS